MSNQNFKFFFLILYFYFRRVFVSSASSSIGISGTRKKWNVSEVLWSRSEAVTSVTWVTGPAWRGSRDAWHSDVGDTSHSIFPSQQLERESGATPTDRRRGWQTSLWFSWRKCSGAEKLFMRKLWKTNIIITSYECLQTEWRRCNNTERDKWETRD